MTSFTLAELSDKTMLATIALASNRDWVGVWIGTSVGMVVADGLAIVAGILLHRRLPEGFLHVLASLLFLLFGSWMLFDGALGRRWVAVGVTGPIMLVMATMATLRLMRTPPAPAALRAASAGSV